MSVCQAEIKLRGAASLLIHAEIFRMGREQLPRNQPRRRVKFIFNRKSKLGGIIEQTAIIGIVQQTKQPFERPMSVSATLGMYAERIDSRRFQTIDPAYAQLGGVYKQPGSHCVSVGIADLRAVKNQRSVSASTASPSKPPCSASSSNPESESSFFTVRSE